MLRMLLLSGVVLFLSAIALAVPYVGLMTWAWLTLANFHQLTWGGIPFISYNDLVAVTTLLGWLAGSWLMLREPRWLPPHVLSWLLLLFTFWLCVTQFFSLDPDYSYEYFDRFLRVMIFVILCGIMVNNKLRLQAMVWVITLSLGIFAVKGGLFTIITGGGFRVFGPDQTMIEDNNHFGTALAAMIPLFVYLYQTTKHHIVGIGLLGLVALSVFAVLGTHSRGAFITLGVCGLFYLWKSGRKLLTAMAIIVVGLPALLFMPENWSERMRTIETLETVDTFNQREAAWQINYLMARRNPLTGAGLRVAYEPEFVQRFLGDDSLDARAAHSIYFEILGGMGFVGLAIFLGLLAGGWLTCGRVTKLARGKPELEWAAKFGVAGQISLGTFMVGAAAVSMEMWEGYLLVIVLMAAVHTLVRQHLATQPSPFVMGTRRLNPLIPQTAAAKASDSRR